MNRLTSSALALLAALLTVPAALAQDAHDQPVKGGKSDQNDPHDQNDASQVAVLLQQAAAAEETGNSDEAVQLLRAALDLAPKSSKVTAALGRVLYQSGESSEGMALLWHAIELGPKEIEPLVALVDALLAERDYFDEQGDSGNADASLTRARDVLGKVKGEPGATAIDFRLRRVRVLRCFDDGMKEAFEIASGLVAEQPDNLELHAAFTDTAAIVKEFDRALAWYEKAELPPWVTAWYSATLLASRASWNFNQYVDDEQAVKDYAAAEQRIVESARLNDQYFDAASERASFYRSWAGWVRFRQERIDEAWDLFMSAWGRNPQNDNAIRGLYWVCGRHYDQGNLDQAREAYRQLCNAAPDRAEFWNNYALICRDTGQFEESFRGYRRAMDLAPGDARVINDCALILQYHLHRDLDLAERWYIHAEDLSRASRAQAIDQGDEGAIAEHRSVLGDVLVNLARLYADQGKVAESAEHWNELRAVDATRNELPENGAR